MRRGEEPRRDYRAQTRPVSQNVGAGGGRPKVHRLAAPPHALLGGGALAKLLARPSWITDHGSASGPPISPMMKLRLPGVYRQGRQKGGFSPALRKAQPGALPGGWGGLWACSLRSVSLPPWKPPCPGPSCSPVLPTPPLWGEDFRFLLSTSCGHSIFVPSA